MLVTEHTARARHVLLAPSCNVFNVTGPVGPVATGVAGMAADVFAQQTGQRRGQGGNGDGSQKHRNQEARPHRQPL